MDKEKEINEVENQNAYEGINEKLVKFVKAIEFYDDYGKHLLCTENCKECSLKPLCEYRGEQNVNLALHLMDAGYGNVEQAVREFAEELKERSIEYRYGLDGKKVVVVTGRMIDELIKESFGE